MTFNPFPKLQSERLNLREITSADSATILFLRSDKTVNKFIERPEESKTKTIADALKFIEKITVATKKNTSIVWGITVKDSPGIIGSICLWNFSEDRKTAEVGYDLSPKSHGKGIMREALNCVMKFGFNKLNLNKIEAFTHSENEASKKLLIHQGFEYNKNRKDEGNNSNIIFELLNPVT